MTHQWSWQLACTTWRQFTDGNKKIVKFRGISVVYTPCKSGRSRGVVDNGRPRSGPRRLFMNGETGPCKTFQWTSITMGWWFTFIRPAAKCLVCIWNLLSTLIHGALSRKSAGTQYLSLPRVAATVLVE